MIKDAKTLVIGGHTGGIGDEVAQALWANGWFTENVFMPKVDGENGLNVMNEPGVEWYLRDHGPFDQIVYSAGISRLGWVDDLPRGYEDFDDTMAINARGVVVVAAEHAKLFPGHPVSYAVVVSDAAHTPMRGSIAYCMSKAAEEMAVKCLARELGPVWKVVGISPGVVADTGMTNQLADDIPAFRKWTKEEALAYEMKSNVLGRRVTKQEVADAVFFALTGPQALNGSIITINGGK